MGGSGTLPDTPPSMPRSAHAPLTYLDAFDMAVDFLHGHDAEAPPEVINRAIQEAHLDLINAYNWPSLEGLGRIQLHKMQSAGTVEYDATTRRLTISGSMWPAWAGTASVHIPAIAPRGVLCEVQQRLSDTVLLMDESLNPGVGLDAGCAYSIAPRWYPLPAGFVDFVGPMGPYGWANGNPITMTDMAGYQRNHWVSGAIRLFSIGERPGRRAERALYVWPLADLDTPLDFAYGRRPRELVYSGRDPADCAGTISTVAESRDVVGVTTEFEADMQGSLLMVGRTGSALPTGRYGLNRFAQLLAIESVISATAITATEEAATTLNAVKYIVTDPVDVETCAQNAFLRLVEMHIAMKRGLDRPAAGVHSPKSYVQLAEDAILNAMAAANPYREGDRHWPVRNPLNGTVDWAAMGGGA